MSIMQDETGEWHDDGADVGNPISPPKLIWANTNGNQQTWLFGHNRDHAHRYHHDTVVQELREKAEALVMRWDSPAWGGSPENLRHTGEYIAELRAALAKLAR